MQSCPTFSGAGGGGGGTHNYNLSGVLWFMDWVVTIIQKGPLCLGALEVPGNRESGISLNLELSVLDIKVTSEL